MEFREWILFLENQTIAQYLYQQQQLPVKEIKRSVLAGMQQLPFFREGRGKKQKVQELFAKFYTYQWIQARMESLTHREKMAMQQQSYTPQHAPSDHEKQFWLGLMKPDAAGGYVQRTWQEWGAFFSARIDDNTLTSKLNSTDYTADKVTQDVEQWHLDIAARERGPAADDGEVILQLDNIGWKGWTWVSLNRSSCSAEGQAMGHCGNVGQEMEGDNVLSLRDPQNYAHLTFIINDGVLGEMKGRQNTKPVAKYHPAIVELLKHPMVNSMRGGGYAPESNFEFSDLDENTQKQIKQQKPYIDNWVDFLVEGGKLDKIKDILEAPNLTYDDGTFTINTYDEITDLNKFVKEDIDFYFGEDAWQAFETDFSPGWSEIHYYVDDEIEDKIVKWGDAHWDELDDDQKEEFEEDGWDAEDVFNTFEQLQQAVQWAWQDASRSGAEGEAWKMFNKTMSEPPEDWYFWFDMNHPYKLQIDKDGLKETLKDQEQIEYHGGIEDYLASETPWSFEPPYNGWTDFDEEAFKEMIDERLAEIE